MNFQDFEISVEQGHLRSKKLLLKKGKEYTVGENRLIQFYKVAMIRNTTPEDALTGMCAKQFSSICDMAAHPTEYTLQQWREKIIDLRNYTHLLEALVEERQDEE
jgi:hypothetical protein